jgi:curved DNA-binding protein CbpA
MDDPPSIDAAGPDPYEVLGLPSPASAPPGAPPPTDADIRRAFRRLALVKHPDKARGKSAAAAAAEFDALQKAYDALTDGAARAAWDDVLK